MVEKSVNRVEASQAMMGVGMAASVVVARVSLGDADTASRGERVNHPETVNHATKVVPPPTTTVYFSSHVYLEAPAAWSVLT